MSTTQPHDQEFIREAITSAIQREASRIFEEHKEQMIKDLNRDKDIIISGIVLHVMKYVQMETMRDSLVVTIKELPTNLN